MKRLMIIVFTGLFALTFSSCSSRLTVKFETNCEDIIDNVYVEVGQTIQQPANPIKEDYIFDGWMLNGEIFDFTTPITSSIVLVAKWIVAPQEELKLVEALLNEYQQVDGYQQATERLARVIYNYKISYDTLNNINDNFFNYLLSLDNISEINNALAYLIYYYDIVIALKTKKNINNDIVLKDDIKNNLNSNYLKLKNTNLYYSNTNNCFEDEVYMGFILPILFNSLNDKNDFSNIQNWLTYLITNKYLKNFTLETLDDEIIFINNLTNKKYEFTLQQLVDLNDAYHQINDYNQILLVINYKIIYEQYMNNIKQNSLINDLSNNDQKIKELIENNLPNISDNIYRIIECYHILSGFNEKVNNIFDNLKNYQNKENLQNAIISSINFKDQVVQELKSALPDLNLFSENEELIRLFIKLMGLSEEIDISIINQMYTELVEFIDNIINGLVAIKLDNIDIDAITIAIMNNDFDNDAIIQIIKLLTDSIDNSQLLKLSIKKIVDIFDILGNIYGVMIDNYYQVLLKNNLDDTTIEHVENIINNTSITLTYADFDNIFQMVKIFINNDSNTTVDEINNYLLTVTKSFDLLTKELLVEIKELLIEVIYANNNYQYDEVRDLVNTWIEYYDEFKAYLETSLYTRLLGKILNSTIYKDYSYSKRMLQVLNHQYEYLVTWVNEYETEEMVRMEQFLKQMYQDLKIADLKSQINNCYDLLKSNHSLSSDEKAIINEISNIFGFNVIY